MKIETVKLKAKSNCGFMELTHLLLRRGCIKICVFRGNGGIIVFIEKKKQDKLNIRAAVLCTHGQYKKFSVHKLVT